MHVHAVLIVFACLVGLSIAAVTTGTAGGTALRFQGGSDLSSFRKKFSTLPFTPYPKSTDGQTWSMWTKFLMPLGGSRRMFLLGEAGQFMLGTFIEFTSDGKGMMNTFWNKDTVSCDTGLTHSDFFDDWHHVAITAANSTTGANADIKFYIDGSQICAKTSTFGMLDWGALPGASVGTYTDFAKTYADLGVAPDHFNGWIDELAIYNVTLTAAEISARMNTKLTGSETGLQMYYDFESWSDAASGKIDNVASNEDELDLLLGASFQGNYHMGPTDGSAITCRQGYVAGTSDGAVVYCDPARAPLLGPSNLPSSFTATTNGDYIVTAAAGQAITVTLPATDSLSGTTLTYTVSSVTGGGSLGSVSGNTVTYTAPASFTASATFTYTATSSGTGTLASTSTVRVIPAVAPVASDVTSAFVEDNTVTIILASYDAGGLKNSFIITSLPADGVLSELDGSDNVVSSITSVPFTSTSSRFKFTPTQDATAARSFTYNVTNAHGLMSNEAAVSISVTQVADVPIPNPPGTAVSASAAGSGLTLIDLGAVTTDPDSNFVTVLIDELPIEGTLFKVNDVTTSPVSKYDSFAAMAGLGFTTQYASQVIETSTFWPSGTKGWHPDGVLGVQDVFAYGDSKMTLAFYCRNACGKVCKNSINTGSVEANKAYTDTFPFDPNVTTLVAGAVNCPNVGDCKHQLAPAPALVKAHPAAADDVCWDAQANHALYGWSEYFTVKFDQEVFVKALEIGENRGMGAIESIEAYDTSTGTWQVIWSGEADAALETMYKTTNQFRTFVPYPLCETNFKTNIIKFKVDTITIDDWNEYDYIKLSGTALIADGILQTGSVFYQPPASSSCVDNFKFSATDCGGQGPRTSSQVTYKIESGAGASAPLCVKPVTQDITETVVRFSPSNFSLSYTDALYYEAVTDEFNTWTYNSVDNKFTFDWSSTNSDKNKYDVTFKVYSNSDKSTLVATQTVEMVIPISLVWMDEDITFEWSECTSSNEYEITFSYLDTKTAIGGKMLPADTTYTCSEIPAGSNAGIVIVILAVIGTIFCGLFSVYIIVKAKHPVIKSSQPMFCIVFATGCALICLQILAFLGEASDAICALRNWLFNCLFTLAFGSIFAKTWRVWRVFSNTHLKKIRLTNMDTLKVMFILFAAEAIILTLGQIIAPYKLAKEDEEFAPGRFITVKVCKSDSGEWHLLTLAYKVVLVFIGCYLSWTTRNVDNAFAESKYIMLAIYQIAIYGLVAAVVAGGDTAVETTLTVQTVCCVFGAVCCVCSVFLPKFLLIQSGQYDQGFKSGSQGTSLNTGGGSGPTAEELEKLEVELERLKGILEENNVEY